MEMLNEATSGLGAVLLPVAAALLFEEMTCGGLVRLLLAPRPETGKREMPSDVSQGVKRVEHKAIKGEGKCSH